jgi:hypothetical protein
MTSPQALDVTPAEAAELIHSELAQAAAWLEAGDLDAALDGYVCALGLALQIGPAPTGRVMAAVLQAAQALALAQDADGLSKLGPAVVGLVAQVRDANALPPTSVMDAWAVVAADLGTLIGQVGLALSIPSDRRTGMMDNARTQAALLDDATGGLFALTAWLDEFQPPVSI